jgi:hypothetical protein
MALVSLDTARCLAWSESGHGMVIFSSAWTPATLKKGSVRSAPTDRPWPRARHRPGVLLVYIVGAVIPSRWLQVGGAATLLVIAIWKLRRARHPSWVGMRVSFWDLTTWSWLMASAHGAGLMVVPVLLGGKSVFCGAVPSSTNSLLSFHLLIAAIAVGVHTISHLIIAGLVAWIVYDFIGWRFCVAHGSILI